MRKIYRIVIKVENCQFNIGERRVLGGFYAARDFRTSDVETARTLAIESIHDYCKKLGNPSDSYQLSVHEIYVRSWWKLKPLRRGAIFFTGDEDAPEEV